MGFTKQDKYFFSIILKHGKIFDEVVQKSYGFNIDLENALKKGEGKISVINKNTGENNSHSFILYGKYNENTETFIWFNNVQNVILQDMIKKDIIGVFSTSYYRGPTIVKLLSKPKINISKNIKKSFHIYLQLYKILIISYLLIRLTKMKLFMSELA